MKQLPISKDLLATGYEYQSNQKVIKSTSHNERVNVTKRDIQYFSGKFTLFARNKKAKRQLQAFLEEVGSAEPFDIKIPGLNETLNVITGMPVLTADYPAGTKTIRCDSYAGELSAGDNIKFTNDSKIYTILNDATSGQDILLSPSLRKNHRAGNTMITEGFGMTVLIEDDKFKMQAQKGAVDILKVSFKFKEKL